MNSKIYRCGWCGNVTDKKGKVLIGDIRQRTINTIQKYDKRLSPHTSDVNGYCCPYGNEEEQRRVTREMALDAGDPSLEGEIYNW